ncbi:serine/threonine-protein kinase SRPK3 [Strigomonas culicis]|nr:serine/threonine-protein kinase SRPK3 [Strigomonas culicis]|eukprot:EPY22083.1 serine/threonine-protein kinase SRPK3 [Strigomonas culicis]
MAKNKKHTKSKASKNPTKKGAKNDKAKRKAKFVDPTSSVSREVRATVAALVEQIEREESDTNEVRVAKKKKRTKAQTLQAQLAENVGIEVKSGMTLKQVVKIMDRKNQQASSHTAGAVHADDDEDEDEGGDDETDEDYSDIANERAKEYRKGGYHPVVVGEIYNNRYRIIKKLGWGYFSTVWLVWDYTEERYHAMKIQKSAKHYSEAAYCEIRLLSEIMKADPNKTRFCTRLNDYFEHSGPNGNHVCMVFDVYGENLLTLMERYEYHGIPLPIVKCICKQVLVALDHIASIDIIHTDLKPENVLLSTPKHSIISLMRHYHPPPLNQRPKLTERDPKTMTKSQRRRYYKKLAKQKEKELNSDPDDDESDKSDSDGDEHKDDSDASKTDPEWEVERFHHIILADFGNSCWTYEQFTDEVQTRQYRSPEVILGEPYSTPIDIWSCACMMFELITGEYLFEPKKNDSYPLDEDHLALMTELLGDLPESMRLGDGKYRRQFYNSNGELRNIKDLRYWNLEDVLHTRHNFTRKKAKEIADFLLPMLIYLPENRATPGEILKKFESFFEIQEDDYEPLCFVEKKAKDEEGSESDSAEQTMESYSSATEDGEEAADDEASGPSRAAAEAYRFWEEHPILNRASLEEKGLTIGDIQAVLSGKTLVDPAAHEAAVDVIHLLSEETDRLSASDGHEADQEDEGEYDEAEEESEGEESEYTSSESDDE